MVLGMVFCGPQSQTAYDIFGEPTSFRHILNVSDTKT